MVQVAGVNAGHENEAKGSCGPGKLATGSDVKDKRLGTNLKVDLQCGHKQYVYKWEPMT